MVLDHRCGIDPLQCRAALSVFRRARSRLSRNFFLGLGSAMLIATYDYWGYYNVCFLGDEVKEPGKTIPRAILLSILLVACLYVVMNISILGVVPWQEIAGGASQQWLVRGVDFHAEDLWAVGCEPGRRLLVMWTAFASVFSSDAGILAGAVRGGAGRQLLSGVCASASAKDGFPTCRCWRWAVVALLFCFFSLADVIAGLVVIRIMLQFLVQAIGLIVLRIRRPDLPRPFRMWLYPLPALMASVGFVFVLVSRTNSMTQIRYALVILVSGVAIYLVRAWRNGEWPFAAHAAVGN